MPSGTQGYEFTSGDITESLINRFRNRKGGGDTQRQGAAQQSAGPGQLAPRPGGGGDPVSVSVVTPKQSFLVSAVSQPILGPASSAIVPTDNGTITKFDSDILAVSVEELKESKKQTALIKGQTAMLKSLIPGNKGGDLAKFGLQEADLEEVEDLSGTQDYERAKQPPWWKILFGLLRGIGRLLRNLGPLLAKSLANALGKKLLENAARQTAAMCACTKASMPAVVPARVRDLGAARRALPAAAVRPALAPARAAQNALPASRALPAARTAQAARQANRIPGGQQQAFNPNVKPQTQKIPDLVEVDRGSFKGSDRRFEALRNQAQRGTGQEADTARRMLREQGANVNVKPATPAVPKPPTATPKPSTGVANAAGDLAKQSGGAKYLIPGATAITSALSFLSGDIAGGIVDAADATGDALVATASGGVAATIGTALTSTAAVLGAGITSSYVGEMTRGVGDWIRGDGNNMALNMGASIVDSLSATLETVGAPFRALWEYVNSGFNIEKSNEVMAEIDSNLREGFRKGLNAFDFMNIIPDEKGGFGTLGLYGDAAKKADAKMRGDANKSPIKNAEGGSYVLDNPTRIGNGRDLMGGEAGKELVTFTPLGKGFTGGLEQAIANAVEAPIKASGSFLISVTAELVKMMGPFGQMVAPAIKNFLQPLERIFGTQNVSLMTSSLAQLGGLGISGSFTNTLSQMFNPRNQPRTDVNQPPANPISRTVQGIQQMFDPSKGTTTNNYKGVLPQGNPQFTSAFGMRWGRMHRGIDIGVDRNSPVTALADGKVEDIYPNFGDHGDAVVVKHADGTKNIYGHVNSTVNVGDDVKKGQVIARVKYWPGKNGGDNTHLHLERVEGGKHIDPAGYLNQMKSATPKQNIQQQVSKEPATKGAINAPATAGSVMLPGIKAAAAQSNNQGLSALAKIIEMNQQNQQGGANRNQGGTPATPQNPFTMPLTDPNINGIAPLNLYRLSQ